MNFRNFLAALLLSLLLMQATVFAATPCDANVDKRIKALVEDKDGFLQVLSWHLQAKENKSSVAPETVKALRRLHCKLEKICTGITTSYKSASDINMKGKDISGILPFTCYGDAFLDPFTEDDFRGDNAVCPFDQKDNYLYYKPALDYCTQKIAITQTQLFPFVYQQYAQASHQDEANYYSAKILSITQRLQNLGDRFQLLNQEIRRSFHNITCRCSK